MGTINNMSKEIRDNGEIKGFGTSEPPDWYCQLFGSGPGEYTFIPNKGSEPNWFWRWTQYIILGNRWVRNERSKQLTENRK